MQYSSVQCSAVWLSAVGLSWVQCSLVKCSAVQWITNRFSVFQACSLLDYTLHCHSHFAQPQYKWCSSDDDIIPCQMLEQWILKYNGYTANCATLYCALHVLLFSMGKFSNIQCSVEMYTYSVVQCSALQCSVAQYSTVQCSVVHHP